MRAKDRFLPDEGLNFPDPIDRSVDKYDYLIVFPLTEGHHFGGNQSVDDVDLITWTEIQQIWQQAIPGTDEKKARACINLAKYWTKRTGTEPDDNDSIRISAWMSIAREAIIDNLMSNSGLQLKISASSENIFCRIRAPIKLLELQADKDDYRLQLRGEIDPGSESFWNKELNDVPIEQEEEGQIYTKEEANSILKALYDAGKIGNADVTVYEKETEGMPKYILIL